MKLFKENITPRLSTLGDKIYPLVVDIKKGVKSGDAVNFVTADNEVGILSIELVNGDEPYDISGCIVCGTIQRPDTSTLNIYCDIVGANKLEIPLGVSGTYQEGVHNFDLKIYRGNEKIIGVPTMSYTVTGSLSSDGVVEEEDKLPIMSNLINEVLRLNGEWDAFTDKFENIDWEEMQLHNHNNKSVLDGITNAKVTEWDNKSTFSGSYHDLTNKPSIPSIEGLATKGYVDDEINKIDLSDYVKTVNGIAPNENGNVTITATLEPPTVVDSIEEMADTNKQYVLSTNGFIYTYKKVESPEKVVWVDVLKDVGYQENKRINSSGAIASYSGVDITNYIPCKSGDEVKLEGFSIPSTYVSGSYYQTLSLYRADKTWIKSIFLCTSIVANNKGLNLVEENGYTIGFTLNKDFVSSEVAYMIITSQDITNSSKVLKKTIVPGESGYQWVNTGISFTPADYSGVIAEIKNDIDWLEMTVNDLKNDNSNNNTNNVSVPNYWITELETKADTIQQIMENVGRNKSAFYWYTDVHWQTNARKSPILLKYLTDNTQINKINCGGDVINDPSPYNHVNTKYIHDWRKQIANLPNHHTVLGNHDLNHWSTDVHKMAYANILAHQETNDMVVSDVDGCYYIDCPSEKTRYLYLCFLNKNQTDMMAQGQFIVDSIKSVKEGWHIVVINHRWFQYASSSTPTTGSIPTYEKDILDIFDKYNARETRGGSNYFYAQDFTDSKGKVEFCIGGHIHADYDFKTDGGIPVIITTSDTNQQRHDGDVDSGVIGTITEQAVYAIIADYEGGKINVVGIGRGGSREVPLNL